ncbi:hypothetical protein Tco_0818144 [Tanacetum coccineum]
MLEKELPDQTKIVGQPLVDLAISYALTATTNVSSLNIQQFWKTIHFMVEKEEITYTVDMFPDTLKLPVETLEQSFIPPAHFDYINPFLRILVPKRLEEDYHTIKDDTPLVGVYSIREVTKKRKGTPAAKETSSPRKSLEIRIKKQKPIFTTPLPQSDDREHDENHEATQLSLALDKIAKAYKEQQNMAAVKERLLEEDIKKLIDGDEESSANEFADMVLLDDEDFGDRLEPKSYKDKPKEINDDDYDDEKKKDDKKDADNVDNHDDHVMIRTRVTGSSEIRIKKMQTPISSPPRSPTTDLSSDKAIAQELMVTVTPTPTAPS